MMKYNYTTVKRMQNFLHLRLAVQDVALAEKLAHEIIDIVLQESIEEIANFKKNEKAVKTLLSCIKELIEGE